MLHQILAVSLLVLLAGCESTTQVTSGEEYLSRHGSMPPSTAEKGLKEDGFQEKLRQAASVEPTLTFPARIGIARIGSEYEWSHSPRLTNIPTDEAAEWAETAEKLGKSYGEFVPINPMIAGMFTDTADSVSTTHNRYGYSSEALIKEIRLAAARQHLDAVLIYEVVTKHSRKDNLLTAGNVTILGGFLLPSKTVEAEGYATAMLIDVMQAYPYGTVRSYADDITAYASSWGWGDKYGEEIVAKISYTAVSRLAVETRTMLEKLRKQLAEVQAKKQTKKISSKKK